MSFNLVNNMIKFIRNAFAPSLNFGLGGAALMAGGSLLGGVLGGKAQSDAAKAAAAAAQFRGVDIESGLGRVIAEGAPGDVSFRTELSPEMQAVRDRLMGVGTGALDQFQTFDPQAAGALFTQQLTDIAAPRERQEQLQLENRLFQQGLLGSTTGQKRSEALLGAQNLAAQQRELTGLLQGEQQQARLFERGLGGLQAATTLDQQLANQLQQSIAAGGAQSSAAQAGAQFQFTAGQNKGDAISGFFGQLGQGLGQFAGQSPQQPAGLFTNLPANVSPTFLGEQFGNFQGTLATPTPFGPQ